ncbi:hypothetical protein T492DRAFT_853577 [Pavlovales sp. CCMP2436]|nr:hypothetical protein T492DRAFT_853577 [Pavlovales sp. CCMP2436]
MPQPLNEAISCVTETCSLGPWQSLDLGSGGTAVPASERKRERAPAEEPAALPAAQLATKRRIQIVAVAATAASLAAEGVDAQPGRPSELRLAARAACAKPGEYDRALELAECALQSSATKQAADFRAALGGVGANGSGVAGGTQPQPDATAGDASAYTRADSAGAPPIRKEKLSTLLSTRASLVDSEGDSEAEDVLDVAVLRALNDEERQELVDELAELEAIIDSCAEELETVPPSALVR